MLNISGNGSVGGTLSANNAGLGTTSPISRFHIVSGASDLLPPRLQSSGTTSFDAGWDFYHGAVGKGYVGVPDSAASFGAGEMLLFGNAKTSLWAGGNRSVTLDTNGNVGIGTASPLRTLQIGASINAAFTLEQGPSPNAGFIRFGDGTGWQLHFGRSRESSGGPLDTGTTGVIMTIQDNGKLLVGSLGEGDRGFTNVKLHVGGTLIVDSDIVLGFTGSGDAPLCTGSSGNIHVCGSSRRYKTDVKPFSRGLRLINRLQPVRFAWKTDQQPAIGLIAEDVAKVEPLLTFKNQHDEIEGVNYAQVSVVLINAVKEQQAQIAKQRQRTGQHQEQLQKQQAQLAAQSELITQQQRSIQQQREQLKQQQSQLDGLKRLVCLDHPHAALCKIEERKP